MSEHLIFKSRDEWRNWLSENHGQDESVWLIFEKGKNPTTVHPQDALEEALCFGWIDGLINKYAREEDNRYKKKFSPRRKRSRWSEKNKGLAEMLIKSGLMTESGLKKIEEAKKNGMWNSSGTKPDEKITIKMLESALEEFPDVLLKYRNYPPSARRTLSYYYADAKKEVYSLFSKKGISRNRAISSPSSTALRFFLLLSISRV